MQAQIRQYQTHASSTEIFGRVLCSARNHHFIVDGPEQNGCPGEEITPAELFLSGVGSCGVELIQVLARSAGIPLSSVTVKIQGVIDRSNPVRKDLSLFNSVRIHFHLKGIADQDAKQLLQQFKER